MSVPVLLACFLAVLGLYALGMSRIHTLPAPLEQFLRLAGFLLGLLVTLATFIQSPAILGPDYRFTVSMAQMLLAIELAPPLLLLGVPPAVLASILPSKPSQRPLARILIAGSFSAVVSLGWFIPALFEAASGNLAIWLLRQATLLLCGLALWWPAIALIPIWKPAHSQDLVYLFLFRLPMAIMGQFMTHTNQLSYSPNAVAMEICAPSSLQDQQIGGQVMWTVAALVVVFGLMVIFFQWIKESNSASTSSS
jgi:putative membrane protein